MDDNLQYQPSSLDASPVLRAPDTGVEGLSDPVVCVPTVLSEDYLSNEAVRKAINVDGVNRTEWTECYNLRSNELVAHKTHTMCVSRSVAVYTNR